MTPKFEIDNDKYFIRFIAERIVRGTCLYFALRDELDAEGWVSGIDDYCVQLCERGTYEIIIIPRHNILIVRESTDNNGAILQTASLPENEKAKIEFFTRSLKKKAADYKKGLEDEL